ncbi:MAG: tail fiber domain-containing protein, partial [Bacteroidetes bacterium]|nr:tail fiber domain-containing protein [Bacteroidota bacterium]
AIGVKAGYYSKGNGNVFIGHNAGYSETGNNTLYIDNGSTSSPLIYGDFAADYVKINGKLYVTNPSYGDRKNVQWDENTKEIMYDNSSRRYKSNIRNLEDDFSLILKAQPKTYTRPHSPNIREFGYIAEEMDSLGLTKLVDYDSLGIPDGFNYEKMILYVNEILKVHHEELTNYKLRFTNNEARIEKQEAGDRKQEVRIAELEAKKAEQNMLIEQLLKRIEALESKH